MMESFWGILMAGPRMFSEALGGLLKEHGCPCSDCMNARRMGRPTPDGHLCPCEACQKAREERNT